MATERIVLGGIEYELTTPNDNPAAGEYFKGMFEREFASPHWIATAFGLPDPEQFAENNKRAAVGVSCFASIDEHAHMRLARAAMEQTEPLVLLVSPREGMSHKPTQFIHDPYEGRVLFERKLQERTLVETFNATYTPKPKPKYKNNKLDQKFYVAEEPGKVSTPKRDKAKTKAKKAARKRNRS